jgi:pimeloyl-ACP methyl ester carboxylesterase
MRRHGLAVLFSLSIVAALLLPVRAETPSAGLKNEVEFTRYTALSGTAELVRRLLSPLRALQLSQTAERTGRTLQGQPVDLGKERFSVYVPADPSAASGMYSLLVFIPPWPQAEIPRHWIPLLERHHMVLVTAAHSGNDAPMLDRREPLALLAAHNVMAQYPIDPQHVYVGGFSGGARVALRLALGYPDLFRGALLNAGSDPIGSVDVPLPPADLFRRFQESSRLVYLTGERDETNVGSEMLSRRSLTGWCMWNVVSVPEHRAGHELADDSTFGRSLEALLAAPQAQPQKLAECRARIDKDLDVQLAAAEVALARGDSSSAKRQLSKIDDRFGGLAAPRSTDLASRQGSGLRH